jgi:hypothetical protein
MLPTLVFAPAWPFYQEQLMHVQPDQTDALRVLRLAVEFMGWKTFEGGRRDRFDAALPLKKDRMYHYDDGKIDIAYDVVTRSHRIDTYIRISIIRGKLLRRRRELVFEAENSSVKTFHPGYWVDYVAELTGCAKTERRELEEREKNQQAEAARRSEEERAKNFGPIDDSAVFKK